MLTQTERLTALCLLLISCDSDNHSSILGSARVPQKCGSETALIGSGWEVRLYVHVYISLALTYMFYKRDHMHDQSIRNTYTHPHKINNFRPYVMIRELHNFLSLQDSHYFFHT